jgi:hypothetical protein
VRVNQIVPAVGAVELEQLLSDFASADFATVAPFCEELLDVCAELSAALFRSPETRAFPEIRALAFWMRRAELQRLKQQFDSLATNRTVLVPRGTVFHIPPSNVDTIFVYSWLLSVLTGNRNIVRLSSRQSPQVEAICGILNQVLLASGSEAVRRSTVMLSYGHDEEITSAISSVSDVRVIWGGDRTVASIRSIPLPPHSRELTFPDRFSFSVINADRLLGLDDAGRTSVCERFYNDAFWFDQMACSSPRLVVWCGSPEAASRASDLFFAALAGTAQVKEYETEIGASLSKLSFAHRAILDKPVSQYRSFGNAVTVLTLSDMGEIRDDHCGAGMFFQTRVDDLEELCRFVERRDQTMSYFGFSTEELTQLARSLNGKGVDRIVPLGQALTFNRFWDGVDLMQEMLRRVYVEPEPTVAPPESPPAHASAAIAS